MKVCSLLCFFCLVLCSGPGYSADTAVVNTKLGTIIGTQQDINVFGRDVKIARYLGIPYAAAPVGDLRFRKPVPKQSLRSPFNATKHGDSCLQMDLLALFKESDSSEDCLFLNVYVPVDRLREDLAVMIWLHGGGFVSGASDPFVSDNLATHGYVIVITLNYRLSLWGFLSTGDEHAAGNYGLWDQHLAIKWVHDNIRAFGGDPNRVTIFGESAGAVSVVYQCLFGGNNGLFQRAIAQSGSITPPYAITEHTKENAEKVATLLGCENMDSGPLVDCLREASTSDLRNIPNNFEAKIPLPFTPSIDGEFIKQHPRNMLDIERARSSGSSLFSTIDFMSGVNEEEGLLMIGPFIGVMDPENFKPNRTMFEKELVPAAIYTGMDTKHISELLKDIVIHEYTNWDNTDTTEKVKDALVKVYSDFLFNVPTYETVAYHRAIAEDYKNTYMYTFSIRPSIFFLPTPTWARGPNHADELEYLFYAERGGIMSHVLGKEGYVPQDWEIEVAKYMMTMWSNFAKTG